MGRSSLLLRGSTLSGSEVPSWPLSPPSSRCGSLNKNTTSLAPALSTGSVSRSAPWSYSGYILGNLHLCPHLDVTMHLKAFFYQPSPSIGNFTSKPRRYFV